MDLVIALKSYPKSWQLINGDRIVIDILRAVFENSNGLTSSVFFRKLIPFVERIIVLKCRIVMQLRVVLWNGRLQQHASAYT